MANAAWHARSTRTSEHQRRSECLLSDRPGQTISVKVPAAVYAYRQAALKEGIHLSVCSESLACHQCMAAWQCCRVAWLQRQQCLAVQQRCRVTPSLPGCQAQSPPNLAVQQLMKWSSSALGWSYPCLAAKPHIQKHTRKQQVAPPIARHNLPGMRSQRKGLAAGRGCRVPLLQRRFLCRSLMGCLLSFMHPACQAGQPLPLLEDLGATGLQVQAASMLA